MIIAFRLIHIFWRGYNKHRTGSLYSPLLTLYGNIWGPTGRLSCLDNPENKQQPPNFDCHRSLPAQTSSQPTTLFFAKERNKQSLLAKAPFTLLVPLPVSYLFSGLHSRDFYCVVHCRSMHSTPSTPAAEWFTPLRFSCSSCRV